MPSKKKNNYTKVKPNNKSIFKLPLEKKNYVAVVKYANLMKDNVYILVNVKNLRFYFQNNKDKKLILICYFVLPFNTDLSFLDKFILKGFFVIENVDDFKTEFKKFYNVEEEIILLNSKNITNLCCPKCDVTVIEHSVLINHLKECESFRYTLFGEEVPKELKKSKKNMTNNLTKKTVTNNLIINNTYNYHTSFRKTGDYIRDNISTEQQLAILNSIDKISEMVKYHFMFPEIAENIRIKNTSPYSTCEIFDGKTFKNVNNFDTFRYYVLDHLDSLDYMAYYLKNDKITRALEKYDDNIRKNDQNMAKCIKKTIKDVKFLSENYLLKK